MVEKGVCFRIVGFSNTWRYGKQEDGMENQKQRVSRAKVQKKLKEHRMKALKINWEHSMKSRTLVKEKQGGH